MQKTLRFTRCATSIVLLWMVASCGADALSTGASWGPLAVIGGNESGDDARISGTLLITDDCVLLDKRGELVLLVWPENQTEWDPRTGTVRYGPDDGALAVLGNGDTVSFGGGESYEDEDGMTAEAFLDSLTWVARPGDQCVADMRWFVGELGDHAPPPGG